MGWLSLTTRFDLSSTGRAYVPVFLLPYDRIILLNIEFQVDTGADLTTINKSLLTTRLGYPKEWIMANAVRDAKRTISRAGGKKEPAWYVVIPIANVLGRDLKNWPFYIRIEDDRDYPSLLGIDVLSHFNFTINYGKGYFSAEPEINPAISIPMLSGQEIGVISSVVEDA